MARFVFFIISLFIQMSISFDFCVIYERVFNKRKIFVFSTRFTRFVFCDFAIFHNT